MSNTHCQIQRLLSAKKKYRVIHDPSPTGGSLTTLVFILLCIYCDDLSIQDPTPNGGSPSHTSHPTVTKKLHNPPPRRQVSSQSQQSMLPQGFTKQSIHQIHTIFIIYFIPVSWCFELKTTLVLILMEKEVYPLP